MERTDTGAGALLAIAVEQAAAIDALVGRLADGPLPRASRDALDDVRALVASGDTSHSACNETIGHLVRLDRVLDLALTQTAARARALADRIALAEEMTPDASDERFASARVASLALELERM